MKNTSYMMSMPHGPEPEDDQFVHEYLVLLWRHRVVIVAAMVFCGLAAFVKSWTTGPVYEAVARVIITPGSVASPVPLSPLGYKTLLENMSIAARVIDNLGLSKPPHVVDPVTLLRSHVVVDNVRDANVLSITARMWTPELAADVANRFADGGVEISRRLSQDEMASASDVTGRRFEEMRAALQRADDNLGKFHEQHSIELLRADVENFFRQRAELSNVLVRIEMERARLNAAQQERSTHVRLHEAPLAMNSAAPRIAESRPAIPLRSEAANPSDPVFEIVEQQVVLARTNLAALERQRAELVSMFKPEGPLSTAVRELPAREAELARLRLDRQTAEQTYREVSQQYEQTRLRVAGDSAQLKVLDRASAPRQAVAQDKLSDTIVGMVIGLALAILFVVAYNYVSQSRESLGGEAQTSHGERARSQ